jgi:lipopolysaccharide/colanic/teichoic acid biosynthesis glycosyltransferase
MARALRSRFLASWSDLVLIAAGLALSRLAYAVFFPVNYALLTRGELAGGFLVSLLSYWAAVKFSESSNQRHTLPLLFEEFCFGTGLSLILHALLNYFQLLTRSFFLIIVGGLLAACLLGIARRLVHSRLEYAPAGVVIIGFDPLAIQMARALGRPILGVMGATASALPAGIPSLGEVRDFEAIVAARRPSHILMAIRDNLARPPAAALLKLRLSGIVVSDVPALYEKLFERVYCQGLAPADMLLSPSLCADSRTLAVQAIYTNLIGLLFLIALSPVLALVSLAILVLAGPGPVLESVECSGFQRIPFRLLRFRTLRGDGSGQWSAVGKMITRLHLANLPRLINIVRGEIALFGPRPVRREFAERLTQIMPFYAIRFFVKPGIFGCAPARAAAVPVSELREIEYDLYYIKQASPLFDLEILMRAFSGGGRPEVAGPEMAGAV